MVKVGVQGTKAVTSLKQDKTAKFSIDYTYIVIIRRIDFC